LNRLNINSVPIYRKGKKILNKPNKKITVFYDGACPKCIRDRETYEKLSGKAGEQVCWFDITGKEEHLKEIGVDPEKALSELHVKDEHGQVYSELDAYILLLNKVPFLKPLAWVMGLPGIRPMLASIYHWQVNKRLTRRGL